MPVGKKGGGAAGGSAGDPDLTEGPITGPLVILTNTSQFGTYSLNPDTWGEIAPADVPAGDSQVVTNVTRCGIQFDITAFRDYTLQTVNSEVRIADTPVSSNVILTFNASRNVNATGLIEILLDSDPQAPVFADGSGPDVEDRSSMVSLGTVLLEDLPLFPTLQAYDIALDGDLMRAHLLSKARWGGTIALAIRNAGGAGTIRIRNGLTDTTAISMSMNQDAFFTGLLGDSQPYVRAVRDSRYGVATLSNKLVRDGNDPGLWVFERDRDPLDRPSEYIPDPREGVVDDEIPG